nr:hypothetical protein [Tanacetum cinerariifolium]
MDLFAFIRHSDPTKVRIEERDLAEKEVKLLKITEGRTVSLDPPVTAASGDSGDRIDKLFDEGNDAGQEHSVKSYDDVLEETVAKGASKVIAEKTKMKRKRKVVGDASGPTFPPKKLREDYHAGASGTGEKSLATIRELVLDGSSVLSRVTGPYTVVFVPHIPDDVPTDFVSPAKDAPVTTVVVTTIVTADASIVPPPKDLDSDTLHRIYVPKWNVTNDSVLDDPYVCLSTKVRMRAKYTLERKGELEDKCAEQAFLLSEIDAEIVHLKSLLSLKEAEAAEAIRLRGQLIVVEAAGAANDGELRDLKEKNFALKREKDVMSEKIATLESANAGKEKNSLESAFELFRERMEALKDEHAKILGDRAIGCTVNKGIQDGLKAKIDHGQASKDLSVLEAYDPYEEVKYIDVVNALGAVDFPLLSELESKKDPCIVYLMGSLFLKGTLVIHLWIQRFRGEVKEKRLLLTYVITPLVEPLSSKSLTGEASTFAAPITTLSKTFSFSDVVLPTSVISDHVLDAESHNEDPSVVTFEKEDLDTYPE